MLQVQKLCKAYGRHQVLSMVDFCLPAGQCLGIAGDNGSGKSTLLGILAQTIRPDSGSVLYRGRSVLGDREFLRKHLGYVPQRSELVPSLTAGQQLELWRGACRADASLPGEVEALLGIRELLCVPIREMSGGMRQRVSIAMALSTRPEILVMDEATTGLDASYREALLGFLETYLRRGGRLLWCSHQPEELRRLCGAVLTLHSNN